MPGSALFALLIYFGLPIGLSLLFLRASRVEIATAYVLWIAILLVGSVAIGSRTAGEVVGWAMIFGIFFTTIAIPIIIGICRLVGFSLRGLG